MSIKKWKITAELDWCANNFSSCIVEANTERKARIMAEKYFKKKMKAFAINIRDIELINEEA